MCRVVYIGASFGLFRALGRFPNTVGLYSLERLRFRLFLLCGVLAKSIGGSTGVDPVWFCSSGGSCPAWAAGFGLAARSTRR